MRLVVSLTLIQLHRQRQQHKWRGAAGAGEVEDGSCFDSNLDPWWYWAAAGNTLDCLYNGKLWPYLHNYDVYKCPNDRVMYTHTYSINGYLAGEGAPGADGVNAVILTTGAMKVAYATFVFIEELDPRGYEINSFMPNRYPLNSWNDIPGNMHQNAGIISFADGHAIIWPFTDARTYTLPTQGMATPNSGDLRQIQAWYGTGPYPPGVVQ